MDKTIFNNYGVIIVERNNEFYIKYYTGGMVMREVEDKINIEEVNKAKRSERDAYEVLIAIEKRQRKHD